MCNNFLNSFFCKLLDSCTCMHLADFYPKQLTKKETKAICQHYL